MPLDPKDAFLLASVEWTVALSLAKSIGGAQQVASAIDATERMRSALEAYVESLPADAIEAAGPIGRLKDKIAVSLRWLYGRKSGQIPQV